MKMRKFSVLLAVAALSLALSACSGGGQAAGAPQTVQAYLEARVAGNVDKMTTLSCSDWEPQVKIEASTFASMKAEFVDMKCQESGTDGDATLVACTGKIVTTYQGEKRDWDLSAKQFRVVQQGGEWLMCGYK
jgi:hypothetical protein